jgi:tetratricopeptide (TPR) repeat protein
MPMLMLVFALAFGIQTPATPAPAQRFDMLVRADFFAGFAGDQARLDKAMQFCEHTLAEHPKHAEAMVWHGAGLLFEAGQAFGHGDPTTGQSLWKQGLDQMNAAVALAPDNVGVLIPRGATLITATRNMPPGPDARALLESAVRDYEKVLAIQTPYWDRLGDHAKGELLFGLAEAEHRLGDHAKAQAYFERLATDAPSSGQAEKARTWLAGGALPKSDGIGCVGCHK